MTAEDLGDAWLSELRAQTHALKDIAVALNKLLGIAAEAEGQTEDTTPMHPEHETPQ